MKTTRNMKLPDIVPADISDALLELGIQHKISGDEARAVCPSPDHADANPSWYMNLDTGKHFCQSCGFGGSFQWLIQVMQGKRPGEARAWILMQKPRVGSKKNQSDPLQKVAESDLYKFDDPPEDALLERGVTLEACQTHEIVFDKENNRWIFPLRDPWSDRLIGWQAKGRGDESHLVINHPAGMKKAQTVFGYRAAKTTSTGTVVVTENPIKATKFLSVSGVRAVATCGASFTDYQINELLWPIADSIVFALDNDHAGHIRMSKFIAENAYARDRVKVFNYGNVETINGAYVHTPDDRDPGDLTADELFDGIGKATPAAWTYFEGVDFHKVY